MAQMNILPAGSLLNNRYQIDALIGKGGAGAVYKALDRDSGQTVAIKLLLTTEESGSDAAARQRQFFQREVALLQRVSHPNIISVSDSGVTEQGQPYLVMEYVDGVTLKSIMKAGQLTIERAANILQQIGSALQAIHDQGIIHRDFKPHNVMIAGDGINDVVKLLDFGIAKMIRGNNEEAYLKTLTAKGVIAGTLHYMSPEQCQGRKLDEHTDIYSVGVTAYEMVSGKLPFDSNNPVSLIMLHLDTPPPPVKLIPKQLETVIFRALEKTPEHRYQRISDFVQAFANAVKQSDPLSNNIVILGDGASPDQETQIVNTDDMPTVPSSSSKKASLWDSLKKRLIGE